MDTKWCLLGIFDIYSFLVLVRDFSNHCHFSLFLSFPLFLFDRTTIASKCKCCHPLCFLLPSSIAIITMTTRRSSSWFWVMIMMVVVLLMTPMLLPPVHAQEAVVVGEGGEIEFQKAGAEEKQRAERFSQRISRAKGQVVEEGKEEWLPEADEVGDFDAQLEQQALRFEQRVSVMRQQRAAEASALQGKIRFLEEELQRLKGEYSGNIMVREARIKELEDVLANQGQGHDNGALVEENLKLKSLLEQKEGDIIALQGIKSDAEKLEEEVGALKTAKADLEQKLQKAHAAIEQVPDIIKAERDAAVNVVAREKDILNQELEAKLGAMQVTTADLFSTVDAWKAEVEKLKKENHGLKAQVGRLGRSLLLSLCVPGDGGVVTGCHHDDECSGDA